MSNCKNDEKIKLIEDRLSTVEELLDIFIDLPAVLTLHSQEMTKVRKSIAISKSLESLDKRIKARFDDVEKGLKDINY